MAEVVVALDVPTADEALAMVDRIPGLGWAKVGPTLFLESGPKLVRELKARRVRVFLDLKWHDIPHQVDGAVRAAGTLGVDLATVHALGGPAMLGAAAAARGNGVRIVAVTVLTSHSASEFALTVGHDPDLDTATTVRRLAGLVADSGLDGVVASAQEAAVARSALGPDALIVVPGIRLAGDAVDDQRRTADPRTAAAAGATHLVVGRPITRAEDPARVYHSVCKVASL